jgi:hypothetical protein
MTATGSGRLTITSVSAANVSAVTRPLAGRGEQAGDPDQDATVLAKVTEWLGANVYLCGSCADLDLGYSGSPADTPVSCAGEPLPGS